MEIETELIRKILEEIERLETDRWQELPIEGQSSGQVTHHIRAMQQGNLIVAKYDPYAGPRSKKLHCGRWVVSSLTLDGQAMLNTMRDETLWNRAQQKLAETGATVTVEVLKSSLAVFAGRLLGTS